MSSNDRWMTPDDLPDGKWGNTDTKGGLQKGHRDRQFVRRVDPVSVDETLHDSRGIMLQKQKGFALRTSVLQCVAR